MTGKKVAIIGGGPAGMAAAYQLRRKGIASTIFDDHSELRWHDALRYPWLPYSTRFPR